MDQFELFETISQEVAEITFKQPPPIRIIPIDEFVPELELEDPERWDGLS